MEMNSNVVLVGTVKDEGPYLLEWIAYNRLIGLNNIIMFQNDSFDFTDRMLKVLSGMGVVEYHDNAFHKDAVKKPYQHRAYRRATRFDKFKNATWSINLDADEFLRIDVGNGHISDLTKAVQNFDAVNLNWRLFNHSGHYHFEPDMVTKRFTQTTSIDFIKTRYIPFKTMIKTSSYQKHGIHHPVGPKIENPVIGNGSGLMRDEYKVNLFASTDPDCYKFAQIHHYIIRDAESFLIKAARGRVRSNFASIEPEYWLRYHHLGTVKDETLANRSNEIWDEMIKLDEMSGGVLLKLRQRAIRKWRLKIKAIRETEAGTKFFKQLI